MQITDLAGRHMHELSGGQRQRVLIAQGIVQDHDLLVLDEPLTGLDITSAATIDELIHEQRADGCTVILTTHDLDEARAADWVILVSGRVVATGPPARSARGTTSRWPTGWAACTTGRGSSTTLPTTRTGTAAAATQMLATTGAAGPPSPCCGPRRGTC